jgi:hypothetical protein
VAQLIGSEQDLTDEQKATLATVRRRFQAAERLHCQYRRRWEVFYGLSKNWRRLARAHAQATSARDRDTVMDEFRRTFGTELFIPYGYTVIETNVPGILSSDPTMRVRPLDEDAEPACEPIKRLYERDQKAIAYEMTLQEVVRSGLRFGIGVQKTYWEQVYRKPKMLGLGTKVVDGKPILVHQGPQAEAIDIFDWFWDPAAKNIKTCGYIVHRTWRDEEYIAKRVKTGKWNELDLERIKGMGSDSARGEVWAARMMAAGMTDFDTQGNRLHEVWEYHDGERVVTILDKCLVVQEAPNPFDHGELPFQIFRPTITEHEMVGTGEIEPIAHLQYELNTMRGQRRDAASLALNRGYFYQEGMLDPNNVVTGAGVFVPVLGPPSEAVQPMPFTDIPQSGVEEETALKADIERTSGYSDPADITNATATGTQTVQAAINLRIRQKAKNLGVDLLRPATSQWRELYRQNITSESQTATIRVDDDRTPNGYSFLKVGPKEVNANIEVSPVDGSTEADNLPQQRADALSLATALAPMLDVIDVAKLVKHVLIKFGVEQPDDWIQQAAGPPQPGDPNAPAPGPDPAELVHALGQFLVGHGVDPQLFGQAIIAAQQAAPQTSPPQPTAAPNGAAPLAPVGGP